MVRFFAVTALSDFVLKKRFKYADELASGDHRAAKVKYKCLRVGYKVEHFRQRFRAFSDLAVLSVVKVNL